MAKGLTPEEQRTARSLWNDLMERKEINREKWKAAPPHVQNAVCSAMTAAYDLAMAGRQRVSFKNPFEAE